MGRLNAETVGKAAIVGTSSDLLPEPRRDAAHGCNLCVAAMTIGFAAGAIAGYRGGNRGS